MPIITSLRDRRRRRSAHAGRGRTPPGMAPALGMLIGIGLCFPASAAEWTAQSFIDLGAVRDDNIRLTTAPQESTSGYVAAARLDVERRSETSTARLNGFAAHTRYTTGDVDDRTESGLKLEAENQTSERGTLGLNAEYRREALFETTVIRTGVGDVRDTDVGLTTETQVRRHYRVAQPSWNWLVTERSAVRLAYRLTDVGFSETGTNLVDYREHLLSGTYTRRLTPRVDFNLTANAARYRPDTADTESDTVQLLAGMARAFSETLRGSFAIGAGRTTERTPAQEDSSTGLAITANLRQRSELSTLEGVISRDVTPSGIGRALRTDQARVSWTRQVAPAVEFVLDAQFFRNRVVEGTDPGVDRRYYELAPKLRWRWLERVSVVGSYRYRRQKFDAEAESADSNTVFLGVSYRL